MTRQEAKKAWEEKIRAEQKARDAVVRKETSDLTNAARAAIEARSPFTISERLY